MKFIIFDWRQIIILEMRMDKIEEDLQKAQQNNIRERLSNTYGEVRYRWVVLVIAGMMMILNGLINNAVIPLQSKLTVIYDQSPKVVNAATIISFLVFCLVNIPANYILDKRGIKFGFLLGSSLYMLGIITMCFINVGFPFIIIGFIIFSVGQPFILNSPAELAAYWFLPENRSLAISILVGCNIIGSGLGFAIPTLVVNQHSEGNIAKRQVFSLYMGYAITAIIMVVLNALFLKAKPAIPPSNIEKKEKLSIKQSLLTIKRDRNLWVFFSAFSIFYGTFQIFGASANFLIKPFGYSDLSISIAAIFLILFGVGGAIACSFAIKKTKKYKLILAVLTFGATGFLILLALQLFIVPGNGLTVIIISCLGFLVIPIVPTSYEIGCQVAFPIGQAQVTGLLNVGSVVWAFLVDLIMTASIGFGTRVRTGIFFIILILILGAASFLYYLAKLPLKRKQFQQSQQSSPSSEKHTGQPSRQIQMGGRDFQTQATEENSPGKYSQLNQQKNT